MWKNSIVPRLRLYFILFVLLRIFLRSRVVSFSKKFLKQDAFKAFSRKTYQKNADLLFHSILRLRGLFIKVGQFLSLRVDILPREYTTTLAKLQDRVPPVSTEEIQKRIFNEFNDTAENVFLEFQKESIAAASLAQVHKATLKSGEEAAVKILYPDIEWRVETDLKIIRILLRFIHRFRKQFDYAPIVNEFEKYVRQEINLEQEGKNIEKARENFQDDRQIILPRVLWDYTRKSILTTTFLHGIKITDKEKIKEASIDIHRVGNRVVECYFTQIFKHGFFQADPHPGNLFVIPDEAEGGKTGDRDGISTDTQSRIPNPGSRTPDFSIGIVDFGLCKELPEDFKRGLAEVSLAVFNRDAQQLSDALNKLHFETWDGKPDALHKFCTFAVRHVDDVLYKKPKEINFAQIYQEILELAQEQSEVRIPSDFILVARVMGLLTGLGRTLRAKIDVKGMALKFLL